MFIYFTILIIYIIPIYSIECEKCTFSQVVDSPRNCTTCNGTACIIMEYNYQLDQYHGLKAYEQNCITEATPILPISCRRNHYAHVFCICNSSYCNTPSLISNNTKIIDLSLVKCFDEGAWSHSCPQHLCLTTGDVRYPGAFYPQCAEWYKQIWQQGYWITFDLFTFYEEHSFLLPANSCINLEIDHLSDQICSFTNNYTAEVQSYSKNLTCHMDEVNFGSDEIKDGNCTGTLCISITTRATGVSYKDILYLGCFSQKSSKLPYFKPGVYTYGHSSFYLCDTPLCNKFKDGFGNDRGMKDRFKKDSEVLNCSCPTNETVKANTANGITIDSICLSMSRKISVFLSKVLGTPKMKQKIVPEHQPLVIHENKENENYERNTLPESSKYASVTEDSHGILRIKFGKIKGKTKCFKDVELSLNQLMAMLGIMEDLDFSLKASDQTIMMFMAKQPTDWYPQQKKIEFNIIEGLIPQDIEDSTYWQRFCIELTHFMLKRNAEKTSLNITNHKDGYFQTFTSTNGKTRTLSIICQGLHITEKEMLKQFLTFVPSDSESYKIAEGGLLFGDSLSKVMDTLLEIDKYVIKEEDGNIYYEVNNKPIVIEIGT